MPVGSLLVIPLGEATPEEVALVVGNTFNTIEIAVLDRADSDAGRCTHSHS